MSQPVNSPKFFRQPLALAIALSIGGLSQSALAQETPTLEEVLVTAQKRVETLQEVPISVSALSGDKISEAGIENVEDLTVHLPNLHFTETGISTQIRVRGIGSDNSQGFEQSVGMYIDGIYYGRAQLFRAPMMDMERAELLRGPQSTLFGKNSVAGALNLTTARPTDELTGRVALSMGDEFGEQEVNAMLSGPFTDNFRGRIAIREFEDDGYFYNAFTREDSAMTEESTVRLSLELDASERLSLYLKGERNEFDTVGRPIEMTRDESLIGGLNYNEYLTLLSQPGFDSEADYVRDINLVEYSNNEVNNVTFEAAYEFDSMTLTAVTGLLDYAYNEKCDCDFTAAEILDIDLVEDYDQFSQELRLNSNADSDIEWIAGVYYQSYDQNFDDTTHIAAEGNLLTQLSAQTAVMADTAVWRSFEQSSDTWALFGQMTYSFNPEWHLTVGARYTEETKEAHKVINITEDAEGTTPVTDPVQAQVLGLTYLGVFLLESEQSPGGHDVRGERDESAFTPMINLQHDFSDDIMFYGSYTNGFKAGGFDPRSNRIGAFGTAPSTGVDPLLYFEFEEERADAFEFGMKSTIADGRGEINLALYHTKYEDLQISQFDGGVGFNVGNAKDTTVQGIELDGRWALADGFTLNYGAAWLDFEYKDFENGNCYEGQTRDGADLDNDGNLDTCDYTGKRGVYTPELTLNLSLDYRYAMTGDLDLVGFVDMQYLSSQQVHVNQDPAGEIDGYTLFGARIAIDSNNWTVALVGKNLGDEEIISYSANAPLSGSNFNTNTFYSFVRKPRTIALEGVLKF